MYHAIPTGYTVPFTGLADLSLGANGFVFWDSSSQIPGDLFYESYDGSVFQKILGFGDGLDGKIVQQVLSSEYSYNGGSLAVDVQFIDGSFGIFTTASAVPEPSSLSLLAIGATGLVLVSRTRGRVKRVNG
jgi:hypothetical protein